MVCSVDQQLTGSWKVNIMMTDNDRNTNKSTTELRNADLGLVDNMSELADVIRDSALIEVQ